MINMSTVETPIDSLIGSCTWCWTRISSRKWTETLCWRWEASCLGSLLCSPLTSRESRPAAAVPGGRFFPQARREALLPALPGPPQPPRRRVGQPVAAPDWLHRHPAQGSSQTALGTGSERGRKGEKKYINKLKNNNNKKNQHFLLTGALLAHCTPLIAYWFDTFLWSYQASWRKRLLIPYIQHIQVSDNRRIKTVSVDVFDLLFEKL